MSEKVKNITVVVTATLFFLLFFVWCLLKPAEDFSDSERRALAKMPSFTQSAVLSGNFMKNFETYATDQFPARERFRTLKNIISVYLLGQKDVRGLYTADGYISKLEYPMNVDSVSHAADKFRYIYDKYLEGRNVNVYLSVIPDKNCFMAAQNGYPSLDYAKITDCLKEKTDFAEYIDIFDCLELSDYYRTDTHWRQEKITDVAQKLLEGMGGVASAEYKAESADVPFYGVYYGQLGLPVSPEQLYYLDSPVFSHCHVYDYESNGKDWEIPVYELKNTAGKDPYELFLSGSKSLLMVKNEKANTDKKLILFRDSFGSSLAPLLFEEYAEVILVDIRYLSSERLGDFIEFENSDVLFLYSTLVLNNSITLK